jgi:hypothetical protein
MPLPMMMTMEELGQPTSTFSQLVPQGAAHLLHQHH